jgi:ferredoxin
MTARQVGSSAEKWRKTMSAQSSRKPEQPVLRLHVNRERCEGHGLCNAILPELLELDTLGIARAIGHGIVPQGLEERARLAMENCPELAIEIVQG